MNFENWSTYISNPAGLLAQLHWNVSSVFTASTCPIIWTSKCGVQDTCIPARLFSITSCHILQWKGFTWGGSGIFKADEPGGLGQKSPSGVQGQSPGTGSGGWSPPEAEAIWEISVQLLTFTCTTNLGSNKYRRRARTVFFMKTYN